MISALLERWELVFAIVPGLILFLYGIEHFSTEIQRIAGERFRTLLARLTKNRWRGAVLGALVTGIIQSSTATTVIVVGLVNAGTISFMQSLGVIFGANVGTTITAQLVALKLTSFAPAFILLGFIVGLVGGRYKFLGRPIFYFGLVFFSLNLISDSIIPVKEDPAVANLFRELSSLPLAILAGFVFTVIVQSSSVTSGILVLLADGGLIGLSQGIPLLLGAAMGTTTTAIFASHRMSLHARRAASAHFLFNFFGVILLLPFLTPFEGFVEGLGGGPGQQIANALTAFRLFFLVVFLAALTPFKRLVEKLVKGEEEEILFKTKHIGEDIPKEKQVFYAKIEEELRYNFSVVDKLFEESMSLVKTRKTEAYRRVVKYESLNDYLDEQVEKAIRVYSTRKLSREDAVRAVLLVRLSNMLERLGDIGKKLGETGKDLLESGSSLTPELTGDFIEVYDTFRENMHVLAASMPRLNLQTIKKMKGNEKKLRELINKKYKTQLKSLQYTEADTAFIELLSVIESASGKVRDMRKLVESYTKVVVE